MSLDNLIPSIQLTPAEEEALPLLMQNPVIQKYLRLLALTDTKELLSFPALDKTEGELVKAHATIQGRLQTLGTLLSLGDIKPIPKSK